MSKSKRVWKAEVKYKMALRDIEGAAIAIATGYSLNYIYQGTSGKCESPALVKAISDYLGIEPYVTED